MVKKIIYLVFTLSLAATPILGFNLIHHTANAQIATPATTPSATAVQVISSISPPQAKVGETVYIYGSNFDASSLIFVEVPPNSSIIYPPKSRTNTSLKFIIPPEMAVGAHRIRVGPKGGDESSFGGWFPFEVIPGSISLPGDEDTEKSTEGGCLDLQYNLRYRSRDTWTNNEVSALQVFLQENKYFYSEPTGFFGVITLSAVKSFQRDNEISPTGFVGPITRARIKALTCGS